MECSIITVACRRRRPKKTKIARPSAWSWALFWTGLVWWEGLVYVNGRVRESEMIRAFVINCKPLQYSHIISAMFRQPERAVGGESYLHLQGVEGIALRYVDVDFE